MRFHLQTITKQSRYVFNLSYFRYFIFIHFVLVETMYFVLVSIQSMSNDLLHYYRYCWKLILEMFVIHYFKILSKVPTRVATKNLRRFSGGGPHYYLRKNLSEPLFFEIALPILNQSFGYKNEKSEEKNYFRSILSPDGHF